MTMFTLILQVVWYLIFGDRKVQHELRVILCFLLFLLLLPLADHFQLSLMYGFQGHGCILALQHEGLFGLAGLIGLRRLVVRLAIHHDDSVKLASDPDVKRERMSVFKYLSVQKGRK